MMAGYHQGGFLYEIQFLAQMGFIKFAQRFIKIAQIFNPIF